MSKSNKKWMRYEFWEIVTLPHPTRGLTERQNILGLFSHSSINWSSRIWAGFSRIQSVMPLVRAFPSQSVPAIASPCLPSQFHAGKQMLYQVSEQEEWSSWGFRRHWISGLVHTSGSNWEVDLWIKKKMMINNFQRSGWPTDGHIFL